MSGDGYLVAIIGSTSLAGKSLREALPSSKLDVSDVKLLDEDDLVGTLTNYDDGAEIIARLTEEALSNVDIAFLCGSERLTGNCIDMCAGTDTKLIVLGGESEAADVVSATLPRDRELSSPVFLPLSLSNCLATLVNACSAAGELDFVSATALLPTSEIGEKGIQQLHAQTVELLNFGGVPADEFDGQLIFNVHPAFGKPAADGRTPYETRVEREFAQLLPGGPPLLVNAARTPVFFGAGVSLTLRFNAQTGLDRLRDALGADSAIELCPKPKGGSKAGTPLDSSGNKRFQVSRILPAQEDTGAFLLWINYDNILRGGVLDAIDIARELTATPAS